MNQAALEKAIRRFPHLLMQARLDGFDHHTKRPRKRFVGRVINMIPAIRAEYRRIVAKEVA